MFDATITWGDLLKTVLFLLAAGVLFYLLLAAVNLVGILKNIKLILEKNRGSIDDTLGKLPEITGNVAKVSDIIKEEMESIQKVVRNVGKISDSAKDAVDVLKNDILIKAKGILDIIDWFRKLFEKDEKKKEIVYKYKYKPEKETVIQDVSEKNEFADADRRDYSEKDGNNTEYGIVESGPQAGDTGNNQQGAGL